MQHLAASLWKNLGYCSNCIRKAFLTAASAWGLALLIALSDWSNLLPVAVFGAVGLTMLWIAHLVGFARKVTVATVSGKVNMATPSRRAVLPLFARALAFAAFASAMSRQAFADSPCGGWYNALCPPCERRVTVNSPCLPCHSCGANCPQNNNC